MDTLENIAGLCKGLQKAAEGWTANMEKMGAAFADFQQRMVDGMAALQRAAAQWKAIDLNELYRNIEKGLSDAHSRYCLLLVENGWPPAMEVDLLFPDEVIEIRAKLSSSEFKAWLDQELVRRYDQETVEQILKEWERRPCLAPRLPILRQAIEAHMKAMYFVSIPACLAMVEGLLAALYEHRGRIAGREVITYAEKLANSQSGPFSHGAFMQRFIVENVLQGFEHGNPIPEGPSRHAILHGASLNYGNGSNSLKAILLIQLLSSLARFASNPGDGEFHEVGCARFRANPSTVVFYPDPKLAVDQGLKPCATCTPGSK